ncbi:MAG: ATP-binding protein [Acidobacteriota bacterium]
MSILARSLKTPGFPFWRVVTMFLVVLGISVGVSWSAWRTYRNLKKHQYDFLRAEAASVAASVEFRDRNAEPGGLEGAQDWVDELVEQSADSVARISIIRSDRVRQADSRREAVGSSVNDPSVEALFLSQKVYEERWFRSGEMPYYEVFLPVHLRSLPVGSASAEIPSFAVVSITLDANPAEAIMREGRVHLVLTVSACVLLLAMTSYYLLTLRRAYVLEQRQAEEQQWNLLGRMSATLAHDIRNPLGAIKGLAQLIAESIEPSDRLGSYAETIVRESRRLEVLVADLLVLSKPAAVHFSSFELGDLLKDVEKLFPHDLAAGRVRLVVEADSIRMSIVSDYGMLKRVLINLFENAIQAMPAGGNLFVSAARVKRSLMIQIDDEGEGLPPAASKIFDAFFTTRAQGTGLGLTICRQIVDQLDGTIELRNRQGKAGASCLLQLPLPPKVPLKAGAA